MEAVRWRRIRAHVFAPIMIAFALGGCGPLQGKGGNSKLLIQFPDSSSSSSISGKVGSLSFNWSRVCYVINITAPDIASPPVQNCEMPRGIFLGSFAPGGSVTAEIPKGKGRKLEIFTYMRASETDACPKLAGGFGQLARSRIARVGLVESFDAIAEQVDVNVTVSAPSSWESIVTQYSLPASCGPKSTEGSPRLHAVVSGSALSTGGAFKIDGVVKGPRAESTLSGGSFKVRLSRKAQD